MATLAQIRKRIESLQREAQALKDRERGGVIERVRADIALYGLTAADLGLRPRRGGRPAAKKGR